jgi:signal transduction histidine kinase
LSFTKKAKLALYYFLLKIKPIILILFIFFCLNCSNSKSDKNSQQLVECMKLASNKKLTYNQQLHYTQRALSLLFKEKNDSITLSNYISLNYNLYILNAVDDLKRSSEAYMKKSLILNSKFHIANSYRWMGIYFESLSVNDSAFYYYLKAEKIFKEEKNVMSLCQNYQDQAQVQFYTNDYLEAEKSLIKALRIAKKQKKPISQFSIYTFLGTTSRALDDHKKSLEYHFKALNQIKDFPRNFKNNCYAIGVCDIGRHYLAINNPEKAIKYFEKGLNTKDISIDSPNIYAILLDGLGKANFDIKNYEKLPDLYIKAANIRNSFNVLNGSNFNKLYLSDYYLIVKDSLKAKKFAHEAFNLSKSFRAPKDMLLCLKQLAKVEPKNALKYSQDYIRISDSMQQLERESRNKFAKIAYETEEITNEKEAAVHQKWIFLGITVLILLIGILLFITISQRTKQKELKFLQEQQKSDEEIYQLIQIQQAKIDEGRDIEKKRIARDLHDSIMNRLASTRLNLHMLAENNNPEAIQKCLPFITGIQDIEKEIRNIAHDLNNDVFINTDSFLAIIQSLFVEQKTLFKTKCHLEIDKTINWDLIKSNKKIHIYRILQEALNNINKHAHAGNIIASIHDRENDILLEIYDDGIGFSFNEKKKGIGLQNIFSRTKAFKGTIEIKSNQGAGTTLIITVPKTSQSKAPDNGNTGKHFNS